MGDILAGEIVTGGRLMRLQTRTYNISPSGNLTVTTSVQDIPGCSITLTTETDNAGYAVSAAVDCSVTSTDASSLIEARLEIDGVEQLGRAVHAMDTATRDTVSQFWDGTLTSAGSHTFKLTAARGSGGAGSIPNSNTKLRVTITEVV